MTGIATASARPAQNSPHPVPRIVAGSLFVGVVVALAAVAAWPIYRDAPFLLLAGVGATVGAGIAAVAWRYSWRGWPVTGALLIALFVLGVPLAVPSRLGDPLSVLRGLGEVASGALLGWKDLVTVDLPVGAYRNLLVPALLVFLVGTCVALLLAWQSGRVAYAAVPVAVVMISFGLFFGRTTVSAPLRLGPLTLVAPVETAVGVGGLLTCLLWLGWRSRDERLRALRRAAASSGVRISRRPSAADQRRIALGAGMVAVAVLTAAIVVPYAARGSEREVLRSGVGPEIAISSATSPLAEYRALFSDAQAQEVLFTVTAEGALPERVRLATLDSYDGEIYRSGGSGQDRTRFVRVPASRDAGAGPAVEAEVAIQALDGIWMPTLGLLRSVQFAGPRASALADRFYYRAEAAAGVQTAGGGLAVGDAYRISAVEPATINLTSIQAPGRVGEGVDAPQNLRTWVDRHVSGSDGAALAGLVSLLRERGYLSHALTAGAEPPVWMQALPGYTFQPSASGHSLARVDTLFERLLERESDRRAAASGNLVAAVGDDEQFATAVALIARELGFPSRVVVGARLSSADPSLPTCAAGVCRAQDLAAWTEVQSAGGDWVPVDVTPQFAQSPSLDVTEQRNPENVTEVRPDAVEDVVPPDPVHEDSGADNRSEEPAALDLAWLWPATRIAAIALLLLALVVGPFVVIAAAKAARRRTRRTQGDPATRIAGGWEEYVDAAVDSGRDSTAVLTRTELADVFRTPAGSRLAVDADHAVFSGAATTAEDAEVFWRTVEEERRALLRGRGVWRSILATVSLRSFVRGLAPSGARPRFAERGSAGFRRPRTSP
ncbi:transglutaminase-like domain-containing protein [Microbacterium sp. zg.B48]|uniref:transglutaminase-like domain-containing protein n=1 Tax=Microbacterium sp. zg.B48 TaxID=2969408 RepID=UPI00214C8B09|nr:transglutaminase-like domain-containing protein [Microbacterium sp. zg.B48]MCR2763226.1 transglutaminase-like domain-containing protein [Microbacterium sp. zg.B48]